MFNDMMALYEDSTDATEDSRKDGDNVEYRKCATKLIDWMLM